MYLKGFRCAIFMPICERVFRRRLIFQSDLHFIVCRHTRFGLHLHTVLIWREYMVLYANMLVICRT